MGARNPRWWCLAVLLALPAAATAADARGFARGSIPAWVQAVEAELPREVPTAQLGGGIYYLLTDRQVRVTATGRDSYAHYARCVMNEAGLESSSQLSIDYDPGYQQLVLHQVRVRRGGVWQDRLARARIQLIQREPELESQVYDGTVSAVVFLDDVRVGDVIDYAFTIRGVNPVFGGRYLDAFDTEWSVPLHRMRMRLLWPRGRTLWIRNHRTALAPASRELGAESEAVWEEVDQMPVVRQASTPASADSYGWVQLSEFETWAEVAGWAQALFAIAPSARAPLAAQVERWRGLPRDEAVLGALRFVQDEVRYMGFELGVSTHRPAPPDQVLTRRFGDCKDKALLLCALLREMGITATPALVHSQVGHGLDEYQPSPLAFDHAVVRVMLEGTAVWVDPTLGGQGGGLRQTWFPRYERALLLEPGTDSLAPLPHARVAQVLTEVREDFAVRDFNSAVDYTITTRMRGRDADGARRDFQERSHDEIEASYLKFYRQQWPGIETRAALSMTDDRPANLVTTVERYRIPRFWTRPKADARPEVELWAGAVGDVAREPPRASRWAPLAVNHPVRVHETIHVDLPEEWDIPRDAARIAGAAMSFSFVARGTGRALDLDYEYESLAGEVAPGAFDAHLKDVDRVRDRLSFRLRRPLLPGGAAAHVNWPIVSLGGTLVLLAIGSALGAYRHGRSTPRRVRAPRLAGIRGGLLVFAAIVVLVLAADLVSAWGARGDYALATWAERTSPAADGFDAGWAPLLVLELTAHVAAVVGGALVLVLLLTRRVRATAAYAGWVVLRAVLLFATALAAQGVGARRQDAGTVLFEAMLVLVPACAGIVYLARSDRARSTLVRA